jgi:putative DNA methylase
MTLDSETRSHRPVRAPKKLIEVALPLDAINVAAAREKSIRHGHPSTLHLWWARRPLAAARAVIFAQLVNDPSWRWELEHPGEPVPGHLKGGFASARRRLFKILEDLVLWENTTNEEVLEKARAEIRKSWRETCEVNQDHPQARELFDPEKMPGLHDPFAGGGTIPLEAQRLGLEAYASDLNPVAVLINKTMIEIPPKFAGRPPISSSVSAQSIAQTSGHTSETASNSHAHTSESDCAPLRAHVGARFIAPVASKPTQAELALETPAPKKGRGKKKADIEPPTPVWKGATGLAEDVRYYGAWMRNEAEKRIGHLYPPIEVTAAMAETRPDLRPYVGQKLTVIAWLWARTVKSPNPAFSHVDVPLASTFILSSKEGKESWVEPIVTGDSYRFEIRVGSPSKEAEKGTSAGKRAAFRCLLSDSPIGYDYIREQGQAGAMGQRLMAIVAEGQRGRVYLAPTTSAEVIASSASPAWKPEMKLPDNTRDFKTPNYGLTTYGDLFTPRQLVALTTFSDLVSEARDKVRQNAVAAGMLDDGRGLEAGGTGATAYAEAVSVYLSFCVDKNTLTNTSLATWQRDPDRLTQAFSRQAIAMTWDFAEANPLSAAGGGFGITPDAISKVLHQLPCREMIGSASQQEARQVAIDMRFISTDPPYYDNIGYADLSDYFYVWMRRSLQQLFPAIFRTLSTPKAEELVATPYRHGSREQADSFFLQGMCDVMIWLAKASNPAGPITLYYSFKQSDTDAVVGTSSTGWETFLEAIQKAGLSISGTWPMRTELTGSLKKSLNALASSIVLVCRPRGADAPTTSRRAFLRELNVALPAALDEMTQGIEEGGKKQSPVAPVDLSQAIIGPGMAVFSKYAAVLEADGSPMSVKTALQLINRFLAEDDFDHDTQFCLHWFHQYGWEAGPFGEADVLARAKATSVQGLTEAGVIASGQGRVRLMKPSEYPADWNPEGDSRVPDWEVLHQLIRAFRKEGETGAGALLATGPVRSRADAARTLAYRLYTLCERAGLAEDARAYNEIGSSWEALENASSRTTPTPEPRQAKLL